MTISPKFRILWVALTLIFVFAATPNIAEAQLVAYISSVTTNQENDSIVLDITVDNFSGDSIVGYTLWLELSHGEYIGFLSDSVFVYDTTFSNCLDDSCAIWGQAAGGEDSCLFWTCLSWGDTTIDSGWVDRGAIDTIGTLSSGWDFIDAAILDGLNKIVKINAIANQGDPFTPGIPSPTSSGLLCRIQAEVKASLPEDSCEMWVGEELVRVPWLECYCDSIIYIEFDPKLTRFSNELGEFIGWAWSDTAWTCVNVPPSGLQECVRKCVEYECLDSICSYEYLSNCYLWECTDCNIWDSAGYVDPAQVIFSDGQIEVICSSYLCGDANGDEGVNVSDAVFIINYVFIGGTAPDPMEAANANCDGSVNVSDAVYIINYVFVGGNPPCDTDGDGEPNCQ